jgi:tetratricopeptide (TPR) repeat protein
MKSSIPHRNPVVTCCAVLLMLLVPCVAQRQTAAGSALKGGASTAAPALRGASHWVALGDRIRQQARTTQAEADYRRTEIAYDRALAAEPACTTAMTGLAWVYGARHEFEQSIDWARRAIALQPENADAYGLWGDALLEIGDYDAAMEKYQRMLDLRPDLASYSRGAHLLFLEGDTARAMALMQKAIAAGGPYGENIAWCQAQLALMLYSQGAYDRAAAILRASLIKAPHNYHLLIAAARVQASLNNYPAAIAAYQAATAMVPQPAAVTALGDLYLLTGRRRAAVRQFALAEAIWRLKRAGGLPTDIQRARFYADHDRNLRKALEEAHDLYRTRKNVVVADTLAWCLYKNGRLGPARRMIRQALRLGTPDARMFFHAGMIHARLGARRLACKYLRAALALSPNFDPVFASQATRTIEQLNQRG